MPDFVHLHTCSDYSLYQSASTVRQLAEKAIEYRMPALALTDKNCLAGAPELTRLLTAHGAVKPIYGVEFLIAPPHTDPIVSSLYPAALVLLAENARGYRNLEKLICTAAISGSIDCASADSTDLRNKNCKIIQTTRQITLTDLGVHADGLIALSGGRDSAVSRAILNGIDPLDVVKSYLGIYGTKNFSLEIWNYGLKEDRNHIRRMQELSSYTGAKLVAANNTCYTEPGDFLTCEILRCIDSGRTLPKEAVLVPEQYFAESRGRHF